MEENGIQYQFVEYRKKEKDLSNGEGKEQERKPRDQSAAHTATVTDRRMRLRRKKAYRTERLRRERILPQKETRTLSWAEIRSQRP